MIVRTATWLCAWKYCLMSSNFSLSFALLMFQVPCGPHVTFFGILLTLLVICGWSWLYIAIQLYLLLYLLRRDVTIVLVTAATNLWWLASYSYDASVIIFEAPIAALSHQTARNQSFLCFSQRCELWCLNVLLHLLWVLLQLAVGPWPVTVIPVYSLTASLDFIPLCPARRFKSALSPFTVLTACIVHVACLCSPTTITNKS